jgi:hypothetical protein
MSTREEPVYSDGELIGWNVTTAPVYAEFCGVGALVGERVLISAGGRFFVPFDINGKIEGERK